MVLLWDLKFNAGLLEPFHVKKGENLIAIIKFVIENVVKFKF
jgi:hypothetical protein